VAKERRRRPVKQCPGSRACFSAGALTGYDGAAAGATGPRAEIEIHAELDRIVLAPEGVVEGRRRCGRVEVGVAPPRMLVLREQRHPMPRELPRRRLVLAAKAEREARRGDVALRGRGKIDVEVVIEERRTGSTGCSIRRDMRSFRGIRWVAAARRLKSVNSRARHVGQVWSRGCWFGKARLPLPKWRATSEYVIGAEARRYTDASRQIASADRASRNLGKLRCSAN
jgi:hypothetical protein